MSGMSHVSSSVLVLTQLTPGSIKIDENLDLPILSIEDEESDNLDPFNKPRLRRALILKALNGISDKRIEFQIPAEPKESLKDIYSITHSEGLLQFLTTAWTRWEELSVYGHIQGSEILGSGNHSGIQPFRPINVALPRDPYQRPSQSVMGAIGYYCSDQCTPITKSLQEELLWDSAVLQTAVDKAMEGMIVYAIPTHPGHHASIDCFGGYCYLNQAAFAARRFQMQHNVSKVAILDIDYHCGNGTASIFYDDPSVLVISIHCDPNFDYPFHSGFSDQQGVGAGEGTTLHLPLPPRTQWHEYEKSLQISLTRIHEFNAEAIVISMGLDTHDSDPCALPGAGFCLEGKDYWKLGNSMSLSLRQRKVIIIQEGGYRMDKIGEAATNVILGFMD